jgi:hypothetical protein
LPDCNIREEYFRQVASFAYDYLARENTVQHESWLEAHRSAFHRVMLPALKTASIQPMLAPRED